MAISISESASGSAPGPTRDPPDAHERAAELHVEQPRGEAVGEGGVDLVARLEDLDAMALHQRLVQHHGLHLATPQPPADRQGQEVPHVARAAGPAAR